MAGIAYNRLFNTRITHTFYEGGISTKDLGVTPTESTMLAMKNSNMLFRNDEGGFRVLYKADSLGAAFISFNNVRLVFSIQLLNKTEFLNFTDLSGYTQGKILYFNNLSNPQDNNLSYSLIDYLRPVTFTYQFPQAATGITDLGNISIKDQAGNTVTPVYPVPTNIIPDAANQYQYPIDFTKLPKGLYNFETWTTNSPVHIIEKIYVDNELASQAVFGIVDILVIDSTAASYPGIPLIQPIPPIPPITDIRVYDMNFVRRETQWKYILVLKSPGITVGDTISIEDTASQAPYGPMSFTRQPDMKVNNIDSAVFTSDSSAVPFYETAKKGLTVKKDLDVVMNNISGPLVGVVSAERTPIVNFNITEIFVII